MQPRWNLSRETMVLWDRFCWPTMLSDGHGNHCFGYSGDSNLFNVQSLPSESESAWQRGIDVAFTHCIDSHGYSVSFDFFANWSSSSISTEVMQYFCITVWIAHPDSRAPCIWINFPVSCRSVSHLNYLLPVRFFPAILCSLGWFSLPIQPQIPWWSRWITFCIQSSFTLRSQLACVDEYSRHLSPFIHRLGRTE